LIENNRVIAVIPARAGSKSVKNKNIRPLAGKPLIAWTIETAQATSDIDRVIVSTDGEGIAAVASEYGAEVYERPAHLASDTALVIDTLRDLIDRLSSEGENNMIIVLLEPTSPLRNVDDIRACLERIIEQKADSVATFMTPDLNPHRAWCLENGAPVPFFAGADPWQPRQLQPEAWQLSGAVYAFVADRLPEQGNALLFGKSGAVIMPKERCIDIDDATDFLVADSLMEKSHGE
jgi:N-acylneuraminate cytidylyltransferase